MSGVARYERMAFASLIDRFGAAAVGDKVDPGEVEHKYIVAIRDITSGYAGRSATSRLRGARAAGVLLGGGGRARDQPACGVEARPGSRGRAWDQSLRS